MVAISNKTRILYIEDDGDSQRLIERILHSQGYDVFVASDGLEGVTSAQKIKPNLILMDINLPHIDGRAVTTRLRSLPDLANIPIVALTADISDGGRELALAAGCVGFLNKPVDVDEFPQQIAAFLQGYTQKLDEASRNFHLQRHAENVVEELESKIRELKTANKMLFKLDRMKSDFIVLASHELYTPLTLVSGYANLLNEQLNEDDVSLPNAKNVANLLNISIERMEQVMQEIMNVSRIAAGRLELSTGPIHFHLLVPSVIKLFAEILEERNLTLIIGDLTPLPLVFGDGKYLKRAIANVIENGIKFTPDGGKLEISGRKLDQYVELVIQDTGIGIPVHERERIFEQFHTLGSIDHHSSSKSAFQGGGMGLGLTISNGIIEAHNGRIWVESSGLDEINLPGSTFYIQIPIRPSDDAID